MSDNQNLPVNDNPYGEVATEEELQAALQAAAATPEGTAKPSKAKPARPPKPEGPIDPGICLCGCGNPKRTVKARFIPGHDAKAKSQLMKVDRGEAKIEDVNPALVAYVAQTPKWAEMFPNVFAKADQPAAEQAPTA